MSLVSSPTLTPAKLAAKCANALESTGPRTAAGKRRIMLNGLRHRRYSSAFGENLVKAGANAELFDWICSRIFDGFQPRSAPERWQAEELAREVWCLAGRAKLPAGFETKPECPLESADSCFRFPLRILRSYAQLAATIPPLLDREFVERQNVHGEPSTPRCGVRAPLATDMRCPLARQEV